MKKPQLFVFVMIGILFLNACNQQKTTEINHIKIYYESGRFGGWPANNGIWIWGNEILVGFAKGYHKDLGSELHNIDRDRPEEHMFARSLDGGETWSLEDPSKHGVKKLFCGTMAPGEILATFEVCNAKMVKWLLSIIFRITSNRKGISGVRFGSRKNNNGFSIPADNAGVK